MIVKEPDYSAGIRAGNDLLGSGRVTGQLAVQLRNEIAGIAAEKQVAYQLKSYFHDSDEIYVFNNLRVEHGDVKAQMDHLVFSKRAFYIVESKSILQTIWVNEHGEFERVYGKKRTSTKSPIEQVKRQQKVLIDLLKANTTKIMSKVLGLQKGFKSWTPKHFVAISEKGKIQGPGRKQFSELMKFDQIASRILDHHKATDVGFLKSLDDKSLESFNVLGKKDIPQVINFLKASDISQSPLDKIKELVENPLYRNDIIAKNDKTEIPAKSEDVSAGKPEIYKCGKCGSSNINIAYGRSYYFKCKDCGGNTPIKLLCNCCSEVMRTRKQKNEFFKICKNCGIDELYFVNS